jgi:hypothetical protein
MNTQRTILKVENTEAGKQYIAQLRNEVKAHNLKERATELLTPGYVAKLKRVDLFGRLGKNNPNRHKYSIRGGRYSFKSQARIDLKDSAYIAIYVNNVVRSKFGGYTLVCQ